MTPEQYNKAQTIWNCVTFLPGSFDKRFCHSISSMPEEQELTPKQAALLEQMWHRYRNQIPNHAAKCRICSGELPALKRRTEADVVEQHKLERWKQAVAPEPEKPEPLPMFPEME